MAAGQAMVVFPFDPPKFVPDCPNVALPALTAPIRPSGKSIKFPYSQYEPTNQPFPEGVATGRIVQSETEMQ